ncbi:MAG: acyltransferase [Chitinivibrionales bacterium]|nr:acyltransferase [Chitinivibrionales bacterium]
MKSIRAASVQFNHVAGDKRANLETIERFVREAAQANADLVVFPEMCITGYWHVRKLSRAEIVALAEPVPDGPSTQALLEHARSQGMVVSAGLIELADDGRLYNTYVVAMPDGSVARHRKIHCFVSRFMSSGREYTVFDTPIGCKMGVLTCYDNNIIENVRITALQGAEILLAPHQTGGCDSMSPHGMKKIDPALWENREKDPAAIEAAFAGPSGRGWLMRWLPSRAHDNGIFVVFSNGVGRDDDEVRTGNAMVLDPYGRVLCETGEAGDAMVTADLDAALLDNCTGRRWMMARRPTMYYPLLVPTGREKSTRNVKFGT